jgi:polysaccharide export outer membrane protein
MPVSFRGRCVALCPIPALASLLLSFGCATPAVVVPPEVPKELTKVSHPVYTIEPPDILQIDLLTAIPKPPYRIRPLDVLTVAVAGALPESPIAGNVTVEPDGTIFLGPPYGSVTVGGLTLEEARKEVEQLLTKFVKKPEATVTLAQTRAAQQVRGPHLVRADGTIGLGIYGAVRVVGLTLPEAKRAVEEQLRTNFRDPEVAVDIIGYNSKVYYVVYDGGGLGQQVIRFPITGNETVLDGVGQMAGLATVSDKQRIWVSRPGPPGCAPQVLPVDWVGITERADTQTNYQLLPGDRIFVRAYSLVTADTVLARVLAPVERLFGVVLLGSGTVNSFRNTNNNNTVP